MSALIEPWPGIVRLENEGDRTGVQVRVFTVLQPFQPLTKFLQIGLIRPEFKPSILRKVTVGAIHSGSLHPQAGQKLRVCQSALKIFHLSASKSFHLVESVNPF
jgi:hypothetical protein